MTRSSPRQPELQMMLITSRSDVAPPRRAGRERGDTPGGQEASETSALAPAPRAALRVEQLALG